MLSFSVCDNVLDAASVFDLFCDMYDAFNVEVKPSTWNELESRYESSQMIVGKDELGEVRSFYIFCILGDVCKFIVIYVDPDYRGAGNATAMAQ